MLDIAGNNLANVNTNAFKAKRITFSELLSETIKKASQPTNTIGGTNPQQMGSGVGISGISANMSQGNIIKTGNPLDLAIEGEGYFIVSDGQQNVYTRAGAFAVDSGSTLIDPATGYKVQRVSKSNEFQIPGDNNIHVPFDVGMPAKATSEILVSGNLSFDEELPTAQTQILDSSLGYTYDNGNGAEAITKISELDQFKGTLTNGTIIFTGFTHDGATLNQALTDYGPGDPTNLDFDIDGNTILQDLVDHLNNNVLIGDNGTATASLINGRLRIKDDEAGYSRMDMTMSYAGDGELETPGYFEMLTAGGEEVKNISINTFDSQGGKHVLSAAFVRTNTENTWDMLITQITGDVSDLTMDNRRIDQITFDSHSGSFTGITSSDPSEFTVVYAHDTASPQTIKLDLGTVGKLNGLTQFAGPSTAVARDQDGYEPGRLSSISIDNKGTVVGAFSNGVKKEVAILQIALFQNTAGLETVGNGYFSSSANSGEAVGTQALTAGAGRIHGSALEKSNADVATEFVNMIQAQNGFQANARTIRVANEVLRELTNLIR